MLRSIVDQAAAEPRTCRLIVYDATDTGRLAIPRVERDADGSARGTGGLTRWWRIGSLLHRGVFRAGAALGATSWGEALAWAGREAERRGERIAELQAWGHGGWGYMGMGQERLDDETMNGSLAPGVDALRDALAPGALVWLRCCSAFGYGGRELAVRLADRLGARVAGHTYIIGAWQSGTHSVAPGGKADWDLLEGVETSGGVARGARMSAPGEPRTVGCLRLGLPDGW